MDIDQASRHTGLPASAAASGPVGAKEIIKRAVYALAALCPIEPRSLSRAVEVCRALRGHGISSTIGRFSRAGDSPEDIVREHAQAVAALAGTETDPSFHLSIKPPALLFEFNRVAAITRTALAQGQMVHFDSHQHQQADATIELLGDVIEHSEAASRGSMLQLGLSLPSRWKRTLDDARWARDCGVMPRIVKGEFPAAHGSDEIDARRGYLALVDLFAKDGLAMAIATHDYALAQEAIRRGQAAGAQLHLELLFGMPCHKLLTLARKTGVPVRFYVPYGEHLFLYGVKHLLMNPHKLARPGAFELLRGCDGKLAGVVGALANGAR